MENQYLSYIFTHEKDLNMATSHVEVYGHNMHNLYLENQVF